MNLNDNRLIIKTLKSGDQKVFSLVYASYYKPLCLFCSSYVSLEEAEEIVQDLMMYVWEKREFAGRGLVAEIFLIYQCQEQGFEFNHPFPYYPSGI